MTTAPAPQETISHYRLIELLGRGSMGEVWLAEDTQLPRQVAVKLLPRHLADDAEAVERLQREAKAAASVDHPAVVTVYEAGLADGRPYVVMQKVEGDTLEKRLAQGRLSIDEAIALGTEIADALAEVHALGIVHRDLKPANIVQSSRGARILDFGVASVKGSPRMTATGSAVGTPLAMSPEQIRGLPPDNRSDLWSLGVILYETLTGKAPFAGDTIEAVTYQLLHTEPVPPSALRPEVGRDFDYIVMKLLRKDPAHRYARAEDLLADLASCCALLEQTGDAAETEPGTPKVPRIAVLYFEVLSADPDDTYLAAGLVDDLIVDLTRVEGIHVASRAEVQPYRERVVPPRTLARELDADYVLTGSVRRAGNRARISAQLVRAADGHAMWAERFDRTLEDLFDVQAEVSKRIVEALQIALKPGERDMLDRSPTSSPEAYTYYLRSRELLDGGRDDNRRAEALLIQAIELDPKFALAHATLGECYAWRGMRWWSSLDEAARKAVPHAKRALELEPDLFEGHFVLAMVLRLSGEKEKLVEAIEKIRRMNPDHESAMEWAAWTYMALGRWEEARRLLEPVVDRHPGRLSAHYMATIHEALGDKDRARRYERQALESTMERVRRHPDDGLARAFLGLDLIREGDREHGIEQIERALATDPGDGRLRYNAACGFARAGLRDRALAELKSALEDTSGFISDWPKRDPDLVGLHEDPEFIEMFGKSEEA